MESKVKSQKSKVKSQKSKVKSQKSKVKSQVSRTVTKAFTLLELLLVITIVAVLAGIILMALNPAQRLGDANNIKAALSGEDIKKALTAYVLANGGSYPAQLQQKFNSGQNKVNICKSGQTCNGGVDLTSDLVTSGYLSTIPIYIKYSTITDSGYDVIYDAAKNSITVEPGQLWLSKGGDTYIGPYDNVPNLVGAYGMRRLNSAYNGDILRLRRSSDNAEKDFTYTALGDLDTDTITTWLGANSGFVVTWYDQSGYGRNATQSVAVNQPLYVAYGQNGKPVISSQDNSDILISPVSISQPFLVSSVFTQQTYVFARGIISGTRQENHPGEMRTDSVVATNNVVALNSPVLQTVYRNGSGSKFKVNQNVRVTYSTSVTFSPFSMFGGFVGSIYEVVIASSEFSDTDIGKIEQVANAYWLVY